jgi:hypothetical protein
MQAKPKAGNPKSKNTKTQNLRIKSPPKFAPKSNKVGPKEYTIFVLWVNILVFRVCG